MNKTLIDYMSEEDYKRYNELLANAAKIKAETPKPARKPRGPMTKEQKIALAKGRFEKAQAKLEAMLAADAD